MMALQHGHGHGHGHGGHDHGRHGHDAHGPRHNRGKHHRGRKYKHWVYSRHWDGYTRRAWYGKYREYLYWCPMAGCWYRYGGAVFYPLEDMTNPDGPDEE